MQSFLIDIVWKKKLHVTKPGTQTRNFTYIDDTINALKIIAEKGTGDEYGIANQNTYSIDEVAKLISNNIEYVKENPANRMSSQVVTKKILDLGWKPRQELADYIKNNLWKQLELLVVADCID